MQKASICGTIWSMCFISKDRGHLTQDNNPILAVLLNRCGTDAMLLEDGMSKFLLIR